MSLLRRSLRLLLPIDRTGLPLDEETAKQVEETSRPAIPRHLALLCLDCDSIFEAKGVQSCPNCGSKTAWRIGSGLRGIGEEEQQ